MTLTCTTDFVGPIQTPAHWQIAYFSDPDQTRLVCIDYRQWFDTPSVECVTQTNQDSRDAVGTDTLAPGDPCYVSVSLVEEGIGTADGGVATIPWSLAGVGKQAQILQRQGGAGPSSWANRLTCSSRRRQDSCRRQRPNCGVARLSTF